MYRYRVTDFIISRRFRRGDGVGCLVMAAAAAMVALLGLVVAGD